jgi:hypothetical protein
MVFLSDPHPHPRTLGLPVEEAGLLPKHHHYVAAGIQVGACDGHLGAPRHGSPAGLQVCESQRLCMKG